MEREILGPKLNYGCMLTDPIKLSQEQKGSWGEGEEWWSIAWFLLTYGVRSERTQRTLHHRDMHHKGEYDITKKKQTFASTIPNTVPLPALPGCHFQNEVHVQDYSGLRTLRKSPLCTTNTIVYTGYKEARTDMHPSIKAVHDKTTDTQISISQFTGSVLRTLLVAGTAVAERLVCLPPTKANRVQSPTGSLRYLPLVGEFSPPPKSPHSSLTPLVAFSKILHIRTEETCTKGRCESSYLILESPLTKLKIVRAKYERLTGGTQNLMHSSGGDRREQSAIVPALITHPTEFYLYTLNISERGPTKNKNGTFFLRTFAETLLDVCQATPIARIRPNKSQTNGTSS
ncbi:hypothetical protein PR048_018876 [Dryococelus australis]|uniref:Uncharacterized protein n=1 Tax=Dryococelus australis TaxID=614101 RepID=A0ABQ9H1Z5_9NEOP|nr:hypothetical protein PR048_018876 [Dryococelus australis]